MTRYPFQVEMRVRWQDPDDGICSCFGTIVEIVRIDEDMHLVDDCDILVIRQDGGGIVEAHPREVFPATQDV